MTIRSHSDTSHHALIEYPSRDISKRRTEFRGETARRRRALALCALLFQLFFAQAALANINSPQGALDVAGIVPGKYVFMDKTKKPIGPAEATMSSVKAIMELMRQAVDVAAMLPEDSPAPERANPSVFVPMTDLDVALKAAAMVPKYDAERPGASASLLMKSRSLLWPVDGFIYSAFNASRSGGRRHGAIDIVTKKDTPIAAAADGVVTVVASGGARFKGYGKVVIIDHGDGVHTLYSHCSSLLVKMGQKVKQGDYIATVGRTGNATTDLVHFEVRVAGKKLDPLLYLPSRPDVVKARNWKSKKS